MKNSTFIGFLILLITIGATLGICLTFAPDNLRYSFWVGVADILVMELVFGMYLMYKIYISSNEMKNKFPTAMHISIVNTIGLFFGSGLLIDIIFLLVNSASLDRVFVWLIIAKWILLLLVVYIFWFTGKQGENEKERFELSRERRERMLTLTDRTLTEYRLMNRGNFDDALYRKVADELETLRNQIRSRVSQSRLAGEELEHISKLLTNLVDSMKKARNANSGNQNASLLEVQTIIRTTSDNLLDPAAKL